MERNEWNWNKSQGMLSIFRTIGVIGDSLASGEFEYDDNGVKGFWDCYEQSWGKYIERTIGSSVTVFARGGQTAYHMYKEADTKTSPVDDINHLFDPDNGKQAYMIALGVNDLLGAGNLENLYHGRIGEAKTDIHPEDYRKNAESFAGTLGKIIGRLQELAPGAKFFLISMPDDGNPQCENHLKCMEDIASVMKNCYVIDLYHRAPKYVPEFRKQYYCGGHMNALGYQMTAKLLIAAADEIICGHIMEFGNVQFTASGKNPYEYRKKSSFVNGEIDEFVQWGDMRGRIINASDGGMIYVDGVYHWYGMSLRALPFAGQGEGGQTTTLGVVMYKSTDLYNWENEGVILPCSGDPKDPLYGPMRFERPKIIYNEKTKKYVLWCHYVAYPGDHGDTPGTAEAGVAVCDTVNGTYEWLGTTRPIDDTGLVRDCTVYKDHDGSAYFIYDRQETPTNRCLHMVKLSDDYISMTDTWRRMDEAFWREAASLTWHDGYYYMITSDLTSWAFNQAKYFRAKELMGVWEDMGDPCIGDEDHQTFHSQSTFVFNVEGTEQQILMLERHNTSDFQRCSYIWLPIHFHEDHTLTLEYQKEWSLLQ